MSKAGIFAALCLCVLCIGTALAQESGPPMTTPEAPLLPQGQPDPGPVLRDGDFGVITNEFGLDRQVEMYQWRAAGDGYSQGWNVARIDSSDFAPGHENPPLPMESQRWWSQDATLDDRPIVAKALQALGEWRTFRPNFSRLPLNMAATFQPEGDGLGSAENPLDPQIGDLRVNWRELHLPALPGRVELRDGVWQMSAQTAAAALNAAPLPPTVEVPATESVWLRNWPWWLAGTALLLGLIALRNSRQRKPH